MPALRSILQFHEIDCSITTSKSPKYVSTCGLIIVNPHGVYVMQLIYELIETEDFF